MLALRSIIPEVASRWETREEVSERELEETRRTNIARCIEELERQAEEEFLQQDSQVDQLMSEHTTAVPLTSLSQPTPEREANLEENMMTHSKVNSILMGEGVEGLLSEVQREREKYPSLLEENRLLEKTQMRMTELAISPGPPPPQLTNILMQDLSPGNLLAVTRVEKRAEAGGAVWVETIVGVSVLALENASRHSRLHSLSPYP